MKSKLAIALSLPLLLTGCINESKDITIEKVGSQTYLIDQKSKEAYIVSRDHLIKLKKSNPTALKIGEVIKRKQVIAQSKIEADASIKLLESNALYRLTVSPVTINSKDGVTQDKSNFEWYQNAIKERDSYNRISLVLSDKDGFKLHEQEVRIARGYVRTVGNGDEVTAYTYEGTIDLNAENSKYVDSIEFVWSIK